MISGWRLILTLLLALPWLLPRADAATPAPPARVSAAEYARLTSWAAANGLAVNWLKRDEKVQLSTPTVRIVLTLDSREVQINGTQVWLSHPIIHQAGDLCISRLDVQSILKPFVAPLRNPARKKVTTICLDPGHGGRDPGNEVGSCQEKRFTLAFAKELRDQLSRAGFKVVLTRTTDSFLELPERAEFAQRRKANLFLCLHFNSAVTSRGSVKGAETYCLTPAGAASTNARGDSGGGGRCSGNRNDDRNILLAWHIQNALVHRLSVEDRGVRRARFAVLRDAVMPAALIEAGFMSHPSEGRRIFTDEYLRQLARVITDGVLSYEREVEK